MSSQVKRGGKVWKAVVGVISTVIIVGLFVALLVLTASGRWIDSVSSDSASVSHAVSQRRITAYCPSRMTLPDASAYGDSEYQPSEGDISSSAGFAAFGAVYRSQFGAFGGSGDTTQLKDLDPTDTAKVIAASADVDRTSLLFDTQLLESAAGVGASASVASWATKGDLRGLSATFCDVGALEQSFVLPDTQTGTTQQLVVANSSSKATVVDVRVWGTEQSGALALSTGSTLTVAANAESVLSLSAAASGQKGLYVTVSSRQTPVSASVRVIRTEGLNPKGSDYAAAAGEASKELVFPAVAEGDKATLTVYAAGSGSLTAAWVGAAGQSVHQYSGDRVTTIDLGDVPKDASALKITADTKVTADVTVSRDGNGNQSDFALIGAAQTDDRSVAVIPSGLDGRVSVVNASLSSKQMHMTGYDDKGAAVGEKTITVDAGAAASFDASDLGKNVFAVAADGKGLAWGVRLSSSAVSDAKLAGIAYIGATPLMPLQERIWARSDMTIVH